MEVSTLLDELKPSFFSRIFFSIHITLSAIQGALLISLAMLHLFIT